MGEKTNVFQYVLMGGFLALAVIAVIIFATTNSTVSNQSAQPVVIWGTLDNAAMNEVLSQANQAVGGLGGVSYVEINPAAYYSIVVEGIATGEGPDLFMIDQENLLTQLNKIYITPYTTFPEQSFKTLFSEGTELFISPDGIIGVPFLIDPLVMYWNRDLFTNAGVAQPPKFWEEFYTLAEKITQVDDNLNVQKSAVALGEFSNISHAKELISTLIMQAGSPIVRQNPDGEYEAVLNASLAGGQQPAISAMRFYTEFSNPIKTSYSWNRSLESSVDAFIAGDLAVYFGFASEANTLARLNPNLNFDMAVIPQIRGGARRLTWGNIFAFAIPKTTKNFAGAFNVMIQLADPASQALFTQYFLLPPVRRDMLAQPQSDTYWSVAYESALIAKAWHDPSRYYSDPIFQKMIESITSGAEDVSGAVSQAQRELANIVR